MSLVDALFEQRSSSGAVLRDGIVAAVSPLTVIVPPSTVASPAAKLDSYTPTVGNFVQVLVQGANRLVLGAVGGVGHRVFARHLTADSFTVTGSFAVVPLGDEVYDTDGFHSTSVNTSRLTVPAGFDGLYFVEARIVLVFGGTIPTRVAVNVDVNAAADGSQNLRGAFASAALVSPATFMVTGLSLLVAGDYVTMSPAQAGGTTVTTQGGSSSVQSTSLKMVRLGG